ncbi:MAG TPA: UDP-3-O-acyl-N-acetylglucosamine deacetylase [Planctomycetaceae bacterium]|nr:UDP-3-O-acyl-N-acetylglucosamine deacetylase [Planctomycetaceae bacterium]
MTLRKQQTIARSVTVSGMGFLTGADITLHFHPAAENTGVAFQRLDLPGTEPIPATLDFVVPRQRRTAISRGGATVEMTEHVMAALAGLQIDNCLVQLDGPEPPGGDGSSLHCVQALLDAGIVIQSAERPLLVLEHDCRVTGESDHSEISAGPVLRRTLVITFELDYGPRSPIRAQQLTFEFSPELFVTNFSFARTFILEAEAAALKAQGYGSRITAKDLLIFGSQGPIENELRAWDECVRHKILDCVGDFALLGCDLQGHFRAYRSGHALNHAICRQVAAAHRQFEITPDKERHAA